MLNSTEKTSLKAVFVRLFRQLKEDVLARLPAISQTSRPQIAFHLFLFKEVLRLNLVPWMTMLWIRYEDEDEKVRSTLGAYLAQDVSEDYPKMLRGFIGQVSEQYQHLEVIAESSVQYCAPNIKPITRSIREKDILVGLLAMAGLEYSLMVCMPWIKEGARRLKFSNFDYVARSAIHKERSWALIEMAIARAEEIQAIPTGITSLKTLYCVSELMGGIFNLQPDGVE